MIWLVAIFIGAVLLTGIYFWWQVRAWHAPVVLAVVATVAWVVGVEALGRAKPAGHMILPMGAKQLVVAYVLDEGRWIYVWLRQGREPIAYRIKWSEKLAREIHEAGKKAKARKTGLMVKVKKGLLFNPGEFAFYPAPPRRPPIKPRG